MEAETKARASTNCSPACWASFPRKRESAVSRPGLTSPMLRGMGSRYCGI